MCIKSETAYTCNSSKLKYINPVTPFGNQSYKGSVNRRSVRAVLTDMKERQLTGLKRTIGSSPKTSLWNFEPVLDDRGMQNPYLELGGHDSSGSQHYKEPGSHVRKN